MKEMHQLSASYTQLRCPVALSDEIKELTLTSEIYLAYLKGFMKCREMSLSIVSTHPDFSQMKKLISQLGEKQVSEELGDPNII